MLQHFMFVLKTLVRFHVLYRCIAALAAAEEAPFLATALEVVSRASTSSEVLSLNLTNLIILIALKVSRDSCDHLLENIKIFACGTYASRWYNGWCYLLSCN